MSLLGILHLNLVRYALLLKTSSSGYVKIKLFNMVTSLLLSKLKLREQ